MQLRSHEPRKIWESPEPFHVVALAASFGGLRAFTRILSALPAGFPAPILLLQHQRNPPSLLAGILSRSTGLTVTEARPEDEIWPGHVYIAPPGRHLLVRPDRTLALSDDPPVQFVRPSADRLFESLAAAFGSQAIAVVLTGKGSDGGDGIRAVRKQGGMTIAQSTKSCDAPDMPANAFETGCVDLVLPLDKIAPILQILVAPRHGGSRRSGYREMALRGGDEYLRIHADR